MNLLHIRPSYPPVKISATPKQYVHSSYNELLPGVLTRLTTVTTIGQLATVKFIAPLDMERGIDIYISKTSEGTVIPMKALHFTASTATLMVEQGSVVYALASLRTHIHARVMEDK